MMTTVLELRDISKSFGKQHVLNHVNLSIQSGDIYGLIGRNGAGKTTILKTIVQLLHADSGQVMLFGERLTASHIKNLERTGSVIETPVANNQLTARQNLTYYCKIKGIVDKNAVDEALEFVDLTNTGKKKFKNFSLGMKQKLGLAIALLNKPDLLILDEPINGLDPIAIVEFRKLLIKLNQTQQTTILISSHILGELYQMSTRFGILNHGEIVKELSKEEFETQSREYVRLECDPTNVATTVLDRLEINDYKVIDSTTIHIYDLSIDTANLVEMLVNENVKVSAIVKQHISLEAYFKSILADQGVA